MKFSTGGEFAASANRCCNKSPKFTACNNTKSLPYEVKSLLASSLL